MVRSAILGCGPRARGHAAAYRHLTSGDLVAICEVNRERLDAFGDAFEIRARYDDFAKLVETERPDVVHLVTLPKFRVPLLTWAVELGVPAVIVEKPLATDLEQLAALEALDGRGTRIAVNHQLRFHRRFQELLADVVAGRIGPVRFIDGSCCSRTSEQGSHLMNLVWAINQNAPCTLVQGNCGGTAGLDEEGAHKHAGPDAAWAILHFANGVRASYLCGAGAPRNDDPSVWMQKRVAAYGAAGHVSWSMVNWTRQLYSGPPEAGPVDYRAEDEVGQALLTQAMFDWLADPTRPHPTRLEIAAQEARTILAVYASTIARAPVELPLTSTADLLPALRAVLER